MQLQQDKNVNSGDDFRTVAAIVAGMKHLPGALLPVLHGVQDVLGYIPQATVSTIADGLNLSRAEVHGVISFYHHFRTAPTGRHVIQLCRAEACQAVGARQLEKHVTAALQIAVGDTSENGEVTLLPVYCLGNCACGPSLQLDDEVYGRVTLDRFDALLRDIGVEQ